MRLIATTSVEAAFLAKVKEDADGCLIWQAAQRGIGAHSKYGGFGQELAHRWAYKNWIGPIPEGHEVHHKCFKELCVNPDCLVALTQPENVQAGMDRWVKNKTHCNFGHELTEENTYRFGPDKRWRACRLCRNARRQGEESCHLPEEVVKIRAALIPPIGYEDTALQSSLQLVLAQELARPAYLKTYVNLTGHYVIMDNGAAEGATLRDSYLLQRATLIKADEVVIPDVIRSLPATSLAVGHFLREAQEYIDLFDYNFMGVIQGRTEEEFKKCVDFYSGIERVTVLGIPRHMIETLNQPEARLFMSQWITEAFPDRFALHLLGTSTRWPAEIKLAGGLPYFRSVDTSMPYNYTIRGLELKYAEVQKRADRPEGYFTTKRNINAKLLQDNINTYLSWADGQEA